MPKQKWKGPRAGKGQAGRSKHAISGPLARGRQLHESGDLAGAQQVYERVLTERPDHPQALHLLGKLVCQLGDGDRGMALIDKSLTHDPHSATAWCASGESHLNAQRPEQALDAFSRALRLDRDDVHINYGLGRTYLQLGKHERAVAYLKRTLTAVPRSAEAHEQLGLALHGLGQCDQAVQSFRRSLEFNPDSPSAHSNLAKAWSDQGRHDLAIISMGRAVALQPDWAALHVNLGVAQEGGGRPQEAIASFAEAARLDPGLETAWRNLGRTYLRTQRFASSVEAFRKAIEFVPYSGERHYELATALVRSGDAEAGVEAAERAVQLEPTNPTMHMALAGIYRDMGRYDEAESSCHEALKQDQSSYLAYALLVFIKRYDDVAALEEIAGRADCQGKNARHIHFAIAVLLDRQGAYERAFSHFQTANGLRAATYDRKGRQDLQKRVESTIDRPLLEEKTQLGASDARPIFIVGMPRSGTTLIEQVLDCHPGVVGVGENPAMGLSAGRILRYGGGSMGYPEGLQVLGAEQLQEIAAGYLSEVGIDPKQPVMPADKTPGNFMMLGMIAALFPKAHIIHARRNPIDTCLSNFFNDFDGEQCLYSYDLDDLNFFYTSYRRTMAHWEEHLPIPIHTLDYEDMVADTEAQVRKLLEFCELEWHPDCMNFHERGRAVFTASSAQVRQPIYKGSVERWKNYETWLGPLRELMD